MNLEAIRAYENSNIVLNFTAGNGDEIIIDSFNQGFVDLLDSSESSSVLEFAKSILDKFENSSEIKIAENTYNVRIEKLLNSKFQVVLEPSTGDYSQKENKFSQLFNGMVSGCAIHDIILDDNGIPVDYRFIDINPAFEELTGLKKEDIIGKTVLEVMPNTEKYWIELYGKVALTGEPIQFENFAAEIGKYYEVSAFSLKKNQFAVVFNDISELKIKEKKLIDSKAGLKLALDAANSGIWEWDFENDICQFDEKLCKMIGCKKEQFIGKFQDLIDIIHPDDVQFIKDEIENTLLADKDFTAEFRVIADQGNIILQSYAKIVYSDQTASKKIIGIMIDVTEEKLEKNIINENARKSQMIFDNIPVGVVMANGRGDLKNINPAFCDLVGYSHDKLYEMNFAKLTHPDYLEREYQLLKQLVDGEIEYYHLEKKYFRKDNSLVDVSVRVSSYFDKLTQELNLMAIVEDITERKQSEHALIDSQQKFSLLFQNLNEAAAIFELECNTNENPKDALLIDANKNFVDKIGGLLGISKDRIFGEEPVSSKEIFIYHSFLNQVNEVISTKKSIRFDHGVPVFDPKAFFSVNLYSIDSKRVAVIMEDITEKKATMKDLMIKDHAIGTALQAIVLADLKGNINYVNRSFLDMWGYDGFEEIEGSNLYKYGDIEMIDKIFKEVFSGGGVIGEGKGIKKNGNEFSIQYSINLVKDNELRPLHMMASFIDITDKVKIEDELRVLNKELELKVEKRTKALNDAMLRLEDQNEELHLLNEGIASESRKLLELNEKLSDSESLLRQANEAKDKFFSIIAHDIKNPLQSLLLSSEILEKYLEKNDLEKARTRSNNIRKSTTYLSGLLENLLDWSRSQTGRLEFNPKKMKLSSIHKNIHELFSQTLSDRKINFLWDDKDLEIFADEILINTVIRNLIGNAIKFTPENGRIVFKARQKENGVIIKVSDTGLGMSEKEQAKLFRIDQQYSKVGLNEEKGTGLGLLICKEFIEHHGGKIEVESKIEVGTTFKFILPD